MRRHGFRETPFVDNSVKKFSSGAEFGYKVVIFGVLVKLVEL